MLLQSRSCLSLFGAGPSQQCAGLGSRGLPPVLRCRALGVHGHRGEDTPKTSWLQFCACPRVRCQGDKHARRGPTGCACITPRLLFRGGDEAQARPCKRGGVGRCACPGRGRTPGRGCAGRRLGRQASACWPAARTQARVCGARCTKACVRVCVRLRRPRVLGSATRRWGLGGTQAGLWGPAGSLAGLGAQVCAGLICQGREQELARGRCGQRRNGKNGDFFFFL